MVESELYEIGVNLEKGDFEVNAISPQNGSWSLGCDIIIEESDAEIQEIRVNDITLSSNFSTDNFTVDVHTEINSDTSLDINFGNGVVGATIMDEINGIKDSLGEVSEALGDINEAIGDINEESLNIKVTINGIQSSVNDLGTEVKTKADATSVIELGEQITEVQTNVYEQTQRVDGLAVELSTKASAESVTTIGESLEITNQTIAEQKTRVDDIEAEISTKASADMVTEVADALKITNEAVAEQTIKVNALEAEISTKASADMVTEVADALKITNEAVAEQTIKVNALEAEISTKASADMVTEVADALKITNEAVAEQTIKVNALESEISTKASADMVTEVAENLKVTNEAVAEQTIKVNALSSEISTKASADSVAELEAGLQATSKSLAEQTIKVSALESEISTKASTESVTSIGDSINVVSETVAEQKIRTDNIEASIENLVTKEVFNAATGEIEAEFASVKQTTDSIETTIKSQSGEIASIKETASGLSIGLGNLESDLDSLRNQMDGVTESYFDDYTPSNTNEPAASWIAEGKEAEHKGDTFTNTAVEGEDAGRSWRWLQDANGEWSWHPIADTDAQKALALAAQAQAAADGKVTIFYVQPSNYKEGDIWFVHNNEYAPYGKGEILTAIKAGSVFSISDWESKTRYTQAVKDLDDVMNTTFKDGVLDEAERITIVESLAGITSEKSAVDARYNITIVNSDFTDTTLKDEYKATKSAYDAAYNNLVSIVEQIADATTGLKDLFDEYVSVSEAYAEAYAEHTEKEAEVTEALMGRLNSASVYLDNITNDGILTPIEKEQLFEIYRNIAKEYEATRSNAYNYRIWKYTVDGVTEEAGINGGDGRYESYVAFKNAYDSIAIAFGSNIWGFTKMSETTTLPDGYSTTLLKEYLDAYYEAHGTLTESFSAITAAIEAAQKAAEATLKELTDNLLPEEMSTLIGKGVVLSTIIATKDAEGKITAGMNASSVHADDKHGRVVFVGGARDINNFNDASFVVYEDGHVKMQSAEIAEYASRGELKDGLDTKADIKDLDDVVAVLQQLSKMWSIDESGNLVTDMQVVIKNNAIIHGDTASGGEGGATSAIGVSGILVNGEVRRDDDGDGIIILDDYPTSIDWDNINGKPTIPTVPTKVSAFANDAGYITEEDIPTIYPLTIKKADGTSLVIYDPEDEEEVITLDKAVVGLGNVENKSSATIRSEITSENVTSALGYTPANNDDLAKYVLLNAANQTIKGDIRIEGNLVVTGDTASGGTSGGGGTSIGVSGIFVNGETRRDDDGDGIIVLPDYPTSLEWSAINGKPTFATVATSGEYSDLNGLPTIPSLDGYATEEWVEGKNYLTSHQEVVNTGYTLSFGSAIIIGTIGGTQLTAALPSVASVKSTLGLDNYLPLSGGTINGNLSVNNGNIVSNYASGGIFLKNGASFYFNDSTGTNRKVVRLASGNVLQLGSTALETAITSGGTIALSTNTSVNGILSVATDITTPLINGGTPIHSNNYSSYALPLSGGTVTGTIEFTASTPALKFYRDYGNVPYIHFGASPTSGYGEVGADKNGNLVFWSLVSGNSAYNAWNTVLHAKNIGEYALKKVANVTSLNTNAGEFFYSGFRPAHIPYGNYVGGITLQTFRDAENDYRTQLAFSTDAKGFVRSYTNGSWSGWKTIAFTDSNVASATKLETARKLWGNNFDGTADVAAQLTFNANDAALSAWKKDGSSTSIFLQVNPDRHLLIGQGTARENGGLYLYGNDIRMCYGNAGSSSNTAMLINASGNVTIGSSDTAGTSYKLRVDGESRFTDRVSVTSLRIIPVNGSYSADFAIDGSSLTLNRELKFTNVPASDICSGIAAAFKTSLAQAENLIARNIILGASSGSASNLAFSFQKYTSISNTAPNGLTTLMTLTTDGNLGIGTASPSEKLHVVGKGLFTDNLTSQGNVIGAAAIICKRSDWRTSLQIGSTGNRGIYDETAAQWVIYTNGTNTYLPLGALTVSGATTLSSTLGVSGLLTAKGGINVTASDGALNTGQSGVAGVFLRNEGGIEISHASTPYIDFHHANGTTDFSHRLIARTSTVFAYSGNYFCPWGSESLGASSYRWKSVYAKAGNFSNDMEINGALTVGAGATFNGDVRINGNLVVTGDTASGGAGQETTSTLLVINQSIPTGSSVSQSALDAIGLTSNVIDDLLEGKYHHVLEVIGSNKSLYTISGYNVSGTKLIILQVGSAEADASSWYTLNQSNGGNWIIDFTEI